MTPLLDAIRDLDARIAGMDAVVEQVGQGYPAVESLQDIPGAGPVAALAYVLSIEDPGRFRRSRDVPGYLGLRPTLRASAATVRQGHVTLQGDTDVRRLLVRLVRLAIGPMSAARLHAPSSDALPNGVVFF